MGAKNYRRIYQFSIFLIILMLQNVIAQGSITQREITFKGNYCELRIDLSSANFSIPVNFVSDSGKIMLKNISVDDISISRAVSKSSTQNEKKSFYTMITNEAQKNYSIELAGIETDRVVTFDIMVISPMKSDVNLVVRSGTKIIGTVKISFKLEIAETR